jgi:multicomponent Na+:H+ antiporter subunit G
VVVTALEVDSVALIALGVLTTAATAIGVVRMKGLYPRLQAASKTSALGAVAILAGSIGTRDGATIARAIVVAVFMLLTAPVSAHAIGRAAYLRDREPASEGEGRSATGAGRDVVVAGADGRDDRSGAA